MEFMMEISLRFIRNLQQRGYSYYYFKSTRGDQNREEINTLSSRNESSNDEDRK
jgi:hypothetical protein